MNMESEMALECPSEVTLKVTGPDDHYAEEWRVREAYWTAAFRSPTLRQMLRWGRILISRKLEAISLVLDDPLNQDIEDEDAPKRRPAAGKPSAPPKPFGDEYPCRTRRFYLTQVFVLKMGLGQYRGQGRDCSPLPGGLFC